jgi:hypothetical protein
MDTLTPANPLVSTAAVQAVRSATGYLFRRAVSNSSGAEEDLAGPLDPGSMEAVAGWRLHLPGDLGP